jgi:lipase chaperone LimK
MSRRTAFAIAASLAGIVLVLGLLASPPPAATPTPHSTSTDVEARNANLRISRIHADALENPGPLPASLAGVSHGIVLATDSRGHLILDDGLVRLFDFYLSVLGEEDIQHVLVRIHRELSTQLREPALAQARDILRRYVDYKLALAGVDAQASPRDDAAYVQALADRLDRVHQLRLSHFTQTEITAFFGLEDAEDDYMTQRLAITHDRQSGPLEKQQQLDALENRLPEDLRAMRKRVTRDSDVYADVQKMRAEGASTEAIHQYRARELGEDAATALARLDEGHPETGGQPVHLEHPARTAPCPSSRPSAFDM